jgi:hypothetical protein
MQKREYQMPESLFSTPDRRDRWFLASQNGASGQWASDL